jgi:diacylglycerol kinase (ATP)
MIRRIHVIINPAAGRDRPILSTLNTVFQDAGIDWDVFITKAAGDARRLAQESVSAGVDAVAAYGGDGTITEVAAGLMGSGVPLAVFPGGTANAIANVLEIPTDLAEACALACDGASYVSTLDMGQIDDRYFLIAVGIGIAGATAEGADRDAKDRLGLLAYVRATLQALSKARVARYSMTLDGQEIVARGVTCLIANAGNFGVPGLSLSPRIDMTDGLLDVIVIRDTDLDTLAALATSMVRQDESVAPFQHWQARELNVVTDPLQPIQADGEVLDPAPVHVRVLPQAVRIVMPRRVAPA